MEVSPRSPVPSVRRSMDRFLDEARALDSSDPLAFFRDRFVIDDPDLIYLDGNSLGRMPRAAVEVLDRLKSEWGTRLVRGWAEGWYDLPARLGSKIATLIGARADEVIVCDSTSVNLYKLASAALALNGGPKRIVTDDSNFPSDLYVLESFGADRMTLIESGQYDSPPLDDLRRAVRQTSPCLLALSHTAFKSGGVYPMADLTREVQEHKGMALWDISHSIGVVPVDLGGSGVELAVGCTYKYLNGGPGAPAFLFVRKDMQEALDSPIHGWFGRHRPFDFETSYQPAHGIGRFLAGTPPILSMAVAEPGIDMVLDAGVPNLREKSLAQTEFLIRLYDAFLERHGFALGSPREPQSRGSHVTFRHNLALAIDQALIHRVSVIPDFRTPDAIRFGISPLYTSFADIYEAVVRLCTVMTEGLYRPYLDSAPTVT